MDAATEQWVQAIQKVGSSTLTHPSFDGRTAREELAIVLWKAAMKGDLRAAALVLKYDQGEHDDLPADEALVSPRFTEAAEKIYGSDAESSKSVPAGYPNFKPLTELHDGDEL